MSLSFFGGLCLTHKKERKIEVREGKREKSWEGGKESIILFFNGLTNLGQNRKPIRFVCLFVTLSIIKKNIIHEI